MKKQGFEVTLLDVHENGIVTAEQVKNAIREDTCLVTIMYANNEIGTVQPIKEIGAVCREKGVIFHTDAVQAYGQIPINPATGNVETTTIEEQTEQVMKNIGAILIEAGVGYEDVVKTTCFLADMNDFQAFNSVYERYFPGKPARSCVAVKQLPKNVLCEVEVIASLY